MRTWLYQTLISSPELQAYYDGVVEVPPADVSTFVFQGESMNSSLVPKPFLVYIIGTDTSERLSEESSPSRQFFQIYVHDNPADYTRIDDLVKIVKRVLINASGPEADVMTVRYLETSTDLDDQTMNTILRYIRFQAIMEE